MFKKIAIAATLAIVSSMSMAADAPSFYVGGDIGSTDAEGSSDRETGLGIFAGYQFNQHIALEAGYRRLVDNDFYIDSENMSATTDQFSLSAIGTVPLNYGFSVYGRLGYNRLSAKVKQSGGDPTFKEHGNRGLYGIGVAYDINKRLAVRVELQKPMSDLTNLSAGLAFRF
jgi:OOP family OmpA-OmpF porin